MKQDRWLLPEGMEELLPPRAWQLEALRNELLRLYHSWGYDLVIPPFVEFTDSLLTGMGTDLDLQTFKLTDQLSGRLMGVRADMTPQVARIDNHSLRRETPSRLCYSGTVLHTRGDGLGGSRSPYQIGVELYGHPGVESDLEVLLLMLESLHLAGLEGLHLDLGHVGIYRGLARDFGLDGATEAALFDALQRKARGEIRELLAAMDLPAAARDMLGTLMDLHGGGEVLAQAAECLATAGPGVRAALRLVERLAAGVGERWPDLPLHFDLAELRGYHYHTGVVFSAYVPGHGRAVAQGGRYDDVGRVFGRARPATGFSADLKTLLSLAGRFAAAEGVARGVYAPCDPDPALATAVSNLRRQGERVIAALPGESGDASPHGCDRELVRRDGAWVLRSRDHD